MTRSLFAALACAALASLSLAGQASAQEYGRIEDTQASAPGYFFFARPGEPTVSVTAVGAVSARGRYLLGVGSTVGDLVALAGGVPMAPRPRGVEEPAEPLVRLYRDGSVLSETPYRDLYSTSAASPRLLDDDVVEVVLPETEVISTARGYFVHARPGEPTVAVTAAGAFAASGRYLVEVGSNVSDLVALAGGAIDRERDARTEVTSTVTVYRDGVELLVSPIEDLYSTTSLTLQDGDVVELSVVTLQRTPLTWRDALTILSAAAAITLAVERVLK